MHWNHRVLVHHQKIGRKKYTHYAIHEVYYNKKNVPISCSLHPDPLLSEDKSELKELFLMMASAFGKPILEYDSFKDKPEKKRIEEMK